MTPKRFFYVLCALLLVILVAGGIGYYYASKSLSDGTTTLGQKLGSQQQADQELDDIQDLQKQYQRLQPLMPIINAALPDQKDQTRIAIDLRNIASLSGMSLDSLTFPSSVTPGPTSQTVKEGDVLAIPISFSLSGSYPQLQAFLQRQEHLDRYTNVTSLTISGSGNDLTFAITLNAYMKP